MSVLLRAKRRPKDKDKDKKVQKIVVRKPYQMDSSGKSMQHNNPCLSGCWSHEIDGVEHTISFSRDTLGVYIDREGVEVKATFYDKEYDTKIEFNFPDGRRGEIYSDADDARENIHNYLYVEHNINGENVMAEVGVCTITFENSPGHYKIVKG